MFAESRAAYSCFNFKMPSLEMHFLSSSSSRVSLAARIRNGCDTPLKVYLDIGGKTDQSFLSVSQEAPVWGHTGVHFNKKHKQLMFYEVMLHLLHILFPQIIRCSSCIWLVYVLASDYANRKKIRVKYARLVHQQNPFLLQKLMASWLQLHDLLKSCLGEG